MDGNVIKQNATETNIVVVKEPDSDKDINCVMTGYMGLEECNSTLCNETNWIGCAGAALQFLTLGFWPSSAQ